MYFLGQFSIVMRFVAMNVRVSNGGDKSSNIFTFPAVKLSPSIFEKKIRKFENVFLYLPCCEISAFAGRLDAGVNIIVRGEYQSECFVGVD